jgi:hypothetical protein
VRKIGTLLEIFLIRSSVLSAFLVVPLFSSAMPEEQAIQPKAFINLEIKEVLIGDPVKVEIIVEGPQGAKFQWPDFKELLPEFSVSQMDIETMREGKDKVRERGTFTITPYKVGTIDLPPFPIPYKWQGSQGVVETGPEQFAVKSVLKEEEELADIKKPVKIPFEVWPIMKWLLAALIIAGAGAMLFYWMRKRQQREKIIPAEDIFKGIPPHEWAYAELDRLLGQRLLEKGLYKEFYIAYSEILKRYLEGRYRIDTLERTTREIRENLMRAKVDRQNSREVLSILEDCDLVKFAKHVPTHERSKKIIQQFYSFIDNTKPQEAVLEVGKEAVRS